MFLGLSFVLFGDKIILTMSNSFLLKGRFSLKQTIANQTCLLGMEPIELFITHKYPNNVFYISSLLGNVTVIGRELFDRLSKNEIRALLTYGIHKTESKNVFYTSFNTLCFSIFFFPLFLLKFLSTMQLFSLGKIFKVLADVATYFYFPALAWNSFLMNKVVNHQKFDREFCQKTGLTHALSSAVFKIRMLQVEGGIKGGTFIMNQVSLLPSINLELGSEMNFIQNTFFGRYKNIYSKESVSR